jgi:hypothetical protein
VVPGTSLLDTFKGFAFSSLFAFSSETCIFVAIRKLDVVDFERVANLRLSLVLRLEMAVTGLFSLSVKVSLSQQNSRAGLPKIGEAGCRQKDCGQARQTRRRVLRLERASFLAPASLVGPTDLFFSALRVRLG